MQNQYTFSFKTLLALTFLLPIFFSPFLAVPLGISKVLLLTVLGLVAFSALLWSSFKDGGIVLPKTTILWAALLLPAIYVVSALFSKTPWLSLFGYGLETGTAASITLLSLIFIITAVTVKGREKLLKIYSAAFISFLILSLFAVIKIISGGDSLVLNNFVGNMGNPVGAWTDYSMIFAVLAILSVLAVEMLSLRGLARGAAFLGFALSLFLLAVINFSTSWILLIILATIFIVYFVTIDARRGAAGQERKRIGIILSGILAGVSLLFLFNPVVSPTKGSLSEMISGAFGVSNTSVRPTFSTTLEVSGAALKENLILGSGPNTFNKSWLLYKPLDINNTPFWNIAFPFGVGFIPTQAASVGLLGFAVWGLFLVSLVALSIKAFTRAPEDGTDRFMLLSSSLVSLFLWISMFVYTPSQVMLAIAFLFSGLFVVACVNARILEEKHLRFSDSPLAHFVSVLVMLALSAGVLVFAVGAYQKIFSAIHLQRAVILSNTAGVSVEEIEMALGRATNLSPNDSLLLTLSNLEIARANAALNSTEGTQEENVAKFQNALSASIAYARGAIGLNNSYENWRALGGIYASLVGEPLNVSGALDEARNTYNSAQALNPKSPEIPLLMARLDVANGDLVKARENIALAIERKSDYVDAYYLLSQIEVRDNNLPKAIQSVETSVILAPGDVGLLFQLGILKYANKDFSGAIGVLNQALALTPDFANAKYYRGLALAELKRNAEAIKDFEEILITNPDNELIESILANLRANKPALQGIPRDQGVTPPIEQ